MSRLSRDGSCSLALVPCAFYDVARYQNCVCVNNKILFGYSFRFFLLLLLQEDKASLVDPLPGKRLPPLESLPRMDVLNRFEKKKRSKTKV